MPPSKKGKAEIRFALYQASVEFEGQSVVKLLKEVRQAPAETQEEIEAVCLKFKEYSCLLSIPGFGSTLSAARKRERKRDQDQEASEAGAPRRFGVPLTILLQPLQVILPIRVASEMAWR